MKRALLLALAAGGMMMFSAADANAHDRWRTRGSNFGISVNLGNPYTRGASFSYNRGYVPRSYYRAPSRSFYRQNYYPPRINYNYVPRSYNRGYGGYGCGW